MRKSQWMCAALLVVALSGRTSFAAAQKEGDALGDASAPAAVFLDPSPEDLLDPLPEGGDLADEELSGNLTSRIAYGTTAQRDAYPFAASVRVYGIHACGGTLIQPRVIMTSAHCVYNKRYNEFYPISSFSFRVGITNRLRGAPRKARGIVRPGAYKPGGYFGDVALLLLDKPVSGTKAKLATTSNIAKSYTALGWGQTQSGYLSIDLKQVKLRRITAEQCKARLKNLKMGGLPRDHFCASPPPGKKGDTCSGDSGGPLLQSSTVQAGITSYGPTNKCGTKPFLGVYTSVDYWGSWIQDVLSTYNMRGLKPPRKFNQPQFDTCYEGGTVRRFKVDSAGRCCDACRNSQTCQAWTFSKTGKNCVFKRKGAFTAKASTACHSGQFRYLS